jgi:hypothetical protein
MHLVANAKTYGNLLNTAVSIKEMCHRNHKATVAHSNLKNLELDLCRRENTMQALRYLLDKSPAPGYANLRRDPQVESLFSGSFLSFKNDDLVWNDDDAHDKLIPQF